jgi:segregation and condensation protein B
VPEISEIRGVDSAGVIATLLDRKLITTAGRKAVIGRPILYKTSKEFLLRFGLKDIRELPSMEEFEKLLAESFQSDLLPAEGAPADVCDICTATFSRTRRRFYSTAERGAEEDYSAKNCQKVCPKVPESLSESPSNDATKRANPSPEAEQDEIPATTEQE